MTAAADGPPIVDVWRVVLDQPPAVAALLGELLDEEERSRAARFHRERLASRFVVAHGALREILSGYLSVPAPSIRFVKGRRGKPALATPGPHFNLSHSAGLALVAVAPDRPVGVDVEHVRSRPRMDAIARRFFKPAEVARLEVAEDDARRDRFFRLWTCKESCIKESGDGIAGLEGVEIAFDAADRPRAVANGWALAEIEAGPAYKAAVAVSGATLALEPRTWRPGLVQ